MIVQRKTRAFSCLHEFRQCWAIISLVFLVVSLFPTVGSANDSYIFGLVFIDTNGNGVHDAGEPVQPNHDLYLEDLTLINSGQGGNFSAVTGEDGKFFFTLKNVGDYNIYTDLGDMYLTTPFSTEGFMEPYRVSISQPSQYAQINFGLSPNPPPPLPVFNNVLEGQILHIACNGDTKDQSGMAHFVENKGVTFVLDKLKHRGRACFFDSSDYLRIPKSTDFNLSNFTISAWFLVEGSYNGTDTRAIISNYDKLPSSTGAQYFGINMGNGAAGAFYDNGSGLTGARDISSPINLANGEWHHIAAVFEGGVNTRLYVDGVPKRQSTGSMPTHITPTGDLYIGRGGVSELMEKRWVGSMDDIRILNRALSTDEVNQLLGIIDLPTGEIFTPLGTGESSPFVISVADDSVSPMMVIPNSTGGYSLRVLPSDSNLRDGNRVIQPPETSTFTMNADGTYTLVDTAQPDVVATLNSFLDLEVTDAKVPELKLILQRNSARFAFQSTENPSIVIRVNYDGTLDIVDETKHNISMTRHKDGTYTIVDRDAQTVTLVSKSGDAVLRHTEYPNVAATFNVFDSQGEYVLVNIDGSECLQVNADGSIGSNIRGGYLDRIIGTIGDSFEKGVASAITTSTDKYVRQAIDAIVTGGSAKLLAGAASTAMASFSNWFVCLPALGQFAVVGVVAIGVVAIVAGVLAFKRMKKEIKQLRGQIQQLTATIQIQAQQIQRLEETVEEQRLTILRLEETVAQLQATINEQAQQIDEQATRIAELEDRIAAQDDEIAKQQEINNAIQERLAELEEKMAQANEGVDQIPEGDILPEGERRAIRGSQCNTLVNFVREILGLERVTPANCQLYGVQDQALNDSIFFTYSPQDNTTVQIGKTHKGCDIEAMAVHPFNSEIYLGSGDAAASCPKGELYKLDAVTGELRDIGPTGFRDISGLAFDNDGNLWGWAKDKGLITLDTYTAQGQIVQASNMEFSDLTWDGAQHALYGVIGTELWSYSPVDQSVNKVCDNLPHKTEAVRVLPTSVLPEGLVLLGSHQNSQFKLQVFDIVNCQEIANQAVFVGYDDVEGFDMPMAACQ